MILGAILYILIALVVWRQTKPDVYKPKMFWEAVIMSVFWLPYFLFMVVVVLFKQ